MAISPLLVSSSSIEAKSRGESENWGTGRARWQKTKGMFRLPANSASSIIGVREDGKLINALELWYLASEIKRVRAAAR